MMILCTGQQLSQSMLQMTWSSEAAMSRLTALQAGNLQPQLMPWVLDLRPSTLPRVLGPFSARSQVHVLDREQFAQQTRCATAAQL